MAIAATLLTRDEVDIVEQNIEHHLEQGVDFFIATDNGSVDGTLDLLEAHPAVKLVIRQKEQDYQQSQWVTRMARILCDYGVDWIVHLDADEFWDGFEHLTRVPAHVTVVKTGTSLIPLNSSGDTCREFAPMRDYDYVGWFDRSALPYYQHAGRRFQFGVKVVHRPCAELVIMQGNHDVKGVANDRQLCTRHITIDHYPIRSYSHFERKVVNGGSAYLKSNLPAYYGTHWREWYQLWQRGVLHEEFARLAYTPESAEQAVAAGTLLKVNPR